MTSKQITLIVILTLSMLAGSGCQGLGGKSDQGRLTATGTLAADEIRIASEIGGLVKSIYVQEGDDVSLGESLFSVDDAVFQAEKDRAAAGAEAAEAGVQTAERQVKSAVLQYDLILQEANKIERDLSAQVWMFPNLAEIDLPVWYYQRDEMLEITLAEVAVAEDRLERQAQKLAAELNADSNQDFLEVEKNLHSCQLAFEIAGHTLDRARTAAQQEVLLDVAQEAYDAALANLESAQLAYERELNSQAADDILEARAKVAAAQADLDYGKDRLLALQTGEQSLQVQAAQAGIDQAQSGLIQAQKMAEQAWTALELLEVQEGKMTTTSPVDGVVLSLNIRAGEIASPGSTLMTIASLDELELVVYLPETEYGQIELGQAVAIEVDSFPEDEFQGEVIWIADTAEFTPRNVQTVEGRKTTVYAVKIRVENLSGELKPGMPANVLFE